MKRLLLLFFCVPACVNAQIVNIPDANFKAKLLEASPMNQISWDLNGNYFTIDTNSDGEIQETEALNVLSINVEDSGISSIVGIESFSNLQYLNCSGNDLTNLDVSQNLSLRVLQCNENQLSELDLLSNTLLNNVRCSYNLLTDLNLTNNPELAAVSCAYNQLTILDLSANPNMIDYVCNNNQITELYIKNGSDEFEFWFADNPLEYICADENIVEYLQQNTDGVVVNSYCSFEPRR